MTEFIYGRNAVMEALRAAVRLQKILLASDLPAARVVEIEKLAQKAGISIERVEKEKIAHLAGTKKTQGVVAIAPAHTYASISAILAQSEARGEPPLLACLDGIEDPHNLGAILRSAEAAGIHGVILPKRRSAGLNATVARTSAGAAAHVLTARVANLTATMKDLKSKGLWFVGAHQEGKQLYTEADLSGPLGIVIGSEGHGLHRLVRENCDFLVRIPMYGRINSLNASVAAALLFYEARRQRETGRA
ncbi:MAG: 23S rRNA (guanosine(2251)-2'-O)-methyltransferase RlmB [Calditrichaeota bacterium]|nr:MAG: 23S rRNA (guanosine(2251)-2'-O)-methyltransferase RlmB [Calditrichota bacterium]